MEEKKLTDEKAMFNYIANTVLGEVKPLYLRKRIVTEILDLIHRLQSDYSNLKERYVKVLDFNEKVIAEQKTEIERLKIDLANEKNWGKIQTKQAVKDTAKEILPEMLARAKRLKEQFDSTTYGTNREHLIATIEIEIEGIKNLAKRYGVEVE